MAAKTTLNVKNLEALGAQRLAELLIEISAGDAAHKRRLRLELAGQHSTAEVVREVRKRLSSIERAKSFIDWHKVKAVKAYLETQRRTIVDTIAPKDPAEAFDLIWHFLSVADAIFERCDDSNGSLIESFHHAVSDMSAIASAAKIDCDGLAGKIFKAVQDNHYSQFDGLIEAGAPALGPEGLERLKTLFSGLLTELKQKPINEDRRVIGWGLSGPVYAFEVYGGYAEATSRAALQSIADLQGDVDSYIAQHPESTRTSPMIAAKIATRLLKAGRAQEALAILDKAETNKRRELTATWSLARAEALEALKRAEEAQDFRWSCFEQSLDDDHLRAYIHRLPDFDDIEAEAKAFAFVQSFPDVHLALHFFLNWPSTEEASKLVMSRMGELDGDRYELMTPAAAALSEKHPLAATILLRSMIDFALEQARSSRYKHAARHLTECRSLASQIKDFCTLQSHDAYLSGLRKAHGRKSGFWSLIP